MEVLVAIVILCIGLLGSVRMQTAALQANTQTREQVTATALAGELAEAMRGNHAAATKTDASANPYLMDRSDWNLLPPPIDCQAGECLGNDDTARLNAAVWQVHEWQMRVQEHLSNPRVQVCFDSTPFDSSGQSNWDCDNAGDVVVAKLAWNHFDTAGALVFGKDAPRPLVVMPVTAGSPS